MSVLASKSNGSNAERKFSKELFTEVSDNLVVFTDEEWESCKDEYKKVLIAAYVRTDVDNLVLIVDDGKFSQIFNVPPFVVHFGLYPHILVDSGMFCAKSLIDQAFNFKSEEAMKKLVTHSTCYPVGAVETSKKCILVFNTVISADLLKDPEIVLNNGFHFRPIETLSLTDSLQREISESLVIVKSEVEK